MTADFSGYATRNNVRCSDGRTILADAFLHQDGETVPLVWQHGHDEPTNVLGHAILENVADGVRAHAYFNQTAAAQHIKESVRNGDIKFMSIFANQLRERNKQVAHGVIREVSLVLGGANPGAVIDTFSITHSDGFVELHEDEAEITTGLEIEAADAISHAATDTVDDADERTLEDILDTLNEEQSTAVNYLLSQALTVESDSVQHDDMGADSGSDDDNADDGEGTDDDSSDDENSEDSSSDDSSDDGSEDSDAEEQDAATAEAEEAAETNADESTDNGSEDDNSSDADSSTDTENEAGDTVQHDNIQEDNSMTHNVFAQSQGGSGTEKREYLSHDGLQAVLKDTLKRGSLKEALEDYVAHTGVTLSDGTLSHGIENIEYLFPDAKLLTNEPSWIARRVEWVDKVLASVRKTPFSRIRTVHADITEDEARARGYIKGNLKVEEFFTLLKRETTPQTIYKKQKLDRDDVLDITDLDVVAFVKAEMKLMLDEEIAGAILIGDARSNGDDDKIKEDKVRPILTDAELYTTTYYVNLDNANSSIDELIDSIIEARAEWKGTGTPSFYTSTQVAAKFRTVKDGFGHRLYKNLKEVAEAIDVAEVIPVEIFNRVPDLVGILVNLADYSIGTDRGGQATMFDDFDLDYNKYRYLLETRLSGALTVPHSAQVFRKVAGSAALVAPTAPARAGNVVTVPTVTGVTYKNAETNATLTTASPVTIATDDTLFVKAVPASASYYFADNANDEWDYEYEA